MEFATINGQFNVAIYLTKLFIIVRITIVCIGSIVIISSTSTSEDTFTAIEFAAIDDKRGYGFACFSVYVSTLFTWNRFCFPKVFAHISATSGIDSVNLSCFRTEDTSFYDYFVMG